MVEHQTGEFFHRNATLLTLFAVMGAITVGLAGALESSAWQRLLVVASLVLFVLSAFGVREHITPPGSPRSPAEYVMADLAYRADIGMFYVAYWLYVAAILGYVLSSATILPLFVLFFTLLIGIFLAREWIVWANPAERTEVDMTMDDDAGQFLVALAQNGLVAAVVGMAGIVAFDLQFGFPIDALLAVRSPSLFDALWIGVLGGLAAGGVLYTFFAGWNYAYRCGSFSGEDPA